MANTTISPNMNLIIPTPGVDPGPDWANNLNASLTAIDQHNHSPGSGVLITPSGININTDLTFNDNNAIQLRSVRFQAQLAPLALATDLGCLYESGVDLWYNDGAGNQVRITQSGVVTGSTGTITGLPSGTASASYFAGTFTFQSATNTPAAINAGPISIGQIVAGSPTVTIQDNSAQTTSYSITLPAALPPSGPGVVLTMTPSGAIGYAGITGSGNVVFSNSPTLTGTTTVAALSAASLNVSGSSFFNGVTASGGVATTTLSVSGTSTLTGAVSVGGTSTLTGAVTVSSGIVSNNSSGNYKTNLYTGTIPPGGSITVTITGTVYSASGRTSLGGGTNFNSIFATTLANQIGFTDTTSNQVGLHNFDTGDTNTYYLAVVYV